MSPLSLRLTYLSATLLLTACASTPYQARTLSGNITLPTALYQHDRDIMVRQRLLDVSGSGGAASVLSEQFLNRPHNNPLTYALPYDVHAIQRDGHYEVDTQVYANGELKLHGVQTLSGSDSGLPATLDVPLLTLTQ